MKTTIESTFPFQAAMEWTVPQRWQPQLFADLDRLQAYDAAAATVQTPDTAKVARALHAREAKAERKHAVLTAGVERYRLQLVSWTGTDTARAKWLVKLLGPGAPHWRYVYDHLKTMQI
jgi:hypothetical protein